MDSTPEDDVAVISRFLARLQTHLADEAETTLKIESELQNFSRGSNLNYDDEIEPESDLKHHRAADLEAKFPPEVQEAEELRKENIRLLLALQRQDYLKTSYEKLLAEHQDLMESINNSIVNRKNYLDVKTINDELQFKDKCSKLEDEVEKLRFQNKKYDNLFDKTINDIDDNLIKVKESLDDEDDEAAEMIAKLEKVRKVIESKEFDT